MLQASPPRLGEAVDHAASGGADPVDRLCRTSMAFFGFHAAPPADLGVHLFHGGVRPHQGRAAQRGAGPDAADPLTVEVFAHAAGLLLLAHTGRIRTFGAAAAPLMEAYVEDCIARLTHR